MFVHIWLGEVRNLAIFYYVEDVPAPRSYSSIELECKFLLSLVALAKILSITMRFILPKLPSSQKYPKFLLLIRAMPATMVNTNNT